MGVAMNAEKTPCRQSCLYGQITRPSLESIGALSSVWRRHYHTQVLPGTPAVENSAAEIWPNLSLMVSPTPDEVRDRLLPSMKSVSATRPGLQTSAQAGRAD